MAITTITPIVATDGVPITFAAQAIPANTGSVTISSPVALADKIGIGKSLDLSVEVSTDGGLTWNFVAGTRWKSYGPNGLTTGIPDPAATVVTTTQMTDPDPGITFPMDKHIGALMRVKATPNGLSQVSLSVAGF